MGWIRKAVGPLDIVIAIGVIYPTLSFCSKKIVLISHFEARIFKKVLAFILQKETLWDCGT